MPVLRFHLLTITHEQGVGEVLVTVTTNAACHLYLRYSDVFPRIHRKSMVRRGLATDWDARYCFTVYQHIEQNEAGDTFTHTFTWPDWENCNTRYFYFWGTMGGQDMVSDTPIFWIHYLSEVTPGPETIFYPILDGWAARDSRGTWAQVHDGIGTYADDDLADMRCLLATHPYVAQWSYFGRAIILFDTTGWLPTWSILTAKLEINIAGRGDRLGISPAINVFESDPLSNDQIVPADYQRLYDTPLSTQIEYADWQPNFVYKTFLLNATGITKIINGGITKLGLRESNWDAPDIDPWGGAPPLQNRNAFLYGCTTEKGEAFRPILTLNEGL